jgi:hypothetical protein
LHVMINLNILAQCGLLLLFVRLNTNLNLRTERK